MCMCCLLQVFSSMRNFMVTYLGCSGAIKFATFEISKVFMQKRFNPSFFPLIDVRMYLVTMYCTTMYSLANISSTQTRSYISWQRMLCVIKLVRRGGRLIVGFIDPPRPRWSAEDEASNRSGIQHSAPSALLVYTIIPERETHVSRTE